MASQLVCRPDQDLPVAVLRVTGALDLRTAGALSCAVRRSLAAQPAGLLLDVTAMELADTSALDTVTEVICETAEWPAVPIVVCGAPAPMTEALRPCPEVSFDADRTAALAKINPDPASVRVRLRPVPDACRQVRQVVSEVCRNHRDLASTAALVATELVANVVRHAQTTMEVTLRLRGERLCLSVRDSSRRMPRPADPALNEAGGRGLRLVRDLSEAWGVLAVPGGKVVWTRMA